MKKRDEHGAVLGGTSAIKFDGFAISPSTAMLLEIISYPLPIPDIFLNQRAL
jgi:hypothetical protein